MFLKCLLCKYKPGTKEMMARWARTLAVQHEGLSSNTQTPHKKQACSIVPLTLLFTWRHGGCCTLQTASLSSSPVKDHVSGN